MKSERQGKVIRGLGGSRFDVRLTDGAAPEILSLYAKGTLHRGDGKVLVGDVVTVTADTTVPDGAVISGILPRKNALIRPPMSNIDVLFTVFAAERPTPVLSTVDQLIAIAEYNGIAPAVVVTKTDLDGAAAARYADIYRTAGFDVFVTAPDHPTDALLSYITNALDGGRTAAVAGASGVG